MAVEATPALEVRQTSTQRGATVVVVEVCPVRSPPTDGGLLHGVSPAQMLHGEKQAGWMAAGVPAGMRQMK